MLKFSSPQTICDIGGVEVGGQPGERPTVLIGSIFHSGHRIVQDPVRGVFDVVRARELLDREAALSSVTGNPRFIDVIGGTSEALVNYIRFVADASPAPILVDSPSQKVRLEALGYFKGSSIVPRLVYNAIAEDFTEEELSYVKDAGVKSAVVLAFSSQAVRPAAKARLLREVLVPAARRASVENILVDTAVLDVPGVVLAAEAIAEVKETFGFPAGCAPANAVYTWKKAREWGTPAFEAAASAVFAGAKHYGADFLMYGPIGSATWVYPAVATADALLAYAARLAGARPSGTEHPLRKIF